MKFTSREVVVRMDFDRRSFGQSKDYLASQKMKEKWEKIQYGYRTWGTRARVFSQTLAHGTARMI